MDPHQRSLVRLALDGQPVLPPEGKLDPLMDVAHSDAGALGVDGRPVLLQQLLGHLGTHPHTVVLHVDEQVISTAVGMDRDDALVLRR